MQVVLILAHMAFVWPTGGLRATPVQAEARAKLSVARAAAEEAAQEALGSNMGRVRKHGDPQFLRIRGGFGLNMGQEFQDKG